MQTIMAFNSSDKIKESNSNTLNLDKNISKLPNKKFLGEEIL